MKGLYPEYIKKAQSSIIKNNQTTAFKNSQDIWRDSTKKKMHEWKISIWKDIQHHRSTGNCKLNSRWDTTTHFLEWPKSKRIIIPSVVENVGQLEPSYIPGGNVKRHNRFEKQFGSLLEI